MHHNRWAREGVRARKLLGQAQEPCSAPLCGSKLVVTMPCWSRYLHRPGFVSWSRSVGPIGKDGTRKHISPVWWGPEAWRGWA